MQNNILSASLSILVIGLLSCVDTSLYAAENLVLPLWENGAPGFESRRDEAEVVERGSVTNVHNPSLTVFLPEQEKANGVGIVIAPGGGLRKLGMRGGGEEPAQFLAEHGFTAFVLKYRLSRWATRDSPGSPSGSRISSRSRKNWHAWIFCRG